MAYHCHERKGIIIPKQKLLKKNIGDNLNYNIIAIRLSDGINRMILTLSYDEIISLEVITQTEFNKLIASTITNLIS